MHMLREEVAILILILILVAIGGLGAAWAQDASEKLQTLVETSARRLAIAQQVALAKWDSQASVEDAAREAQVITAAAKDGESRGLDRAFVVHFFAAQIEANKLVQYSLLANWRRVGMAPAHRPINLAATIRPELNELQRDLIKELADTTAIRGSAACQADTAKAVGKYLAAHKQDAGALQEIALDRAMAVNCI
jgi:chorismate mutase